MLANGGAEDFVFTAFGLDVKNVEILKVFVDGVEQNPVDEAVVARNDAFGVTEDTVSLTGNVLGNDSVPDLVLNVVKTSNPSYGNVVLSSPSGNFTYTPNTAALQSLAAGESLTDSFTYKVTDSDGDVSTATVTITINGTNDAPVISLVSTDSAAKTLTETDSPLSTGGTLTVTDADLSNTVAAAVVTGVTLGGTTGGLTSAAVQNMLTVTAGPIAANPSDAHNLLWNFASNPQAFDYLAAGETLTLTYTVRATDNSGVPLSDDQTVTITVTGSNDAPVITVAGSDSAAKTLAETNAGLGTSGTLTVTDVDLSNTATPSVISVVASNTTVGLGSNNAALLAMLQVTPASIAADPGNTHNLNWAFNSTAEAFDYLAADEHLTLTYTVRASDGTTSDDQTVIITITGTNDAPIVAATDVSGGVTELVTPAGNLTDSGTI
ncbi:VCBS domain-containing protein, partial [Mesorhizobium australicum]